MSIRLYTLPLFLLLFPYAGCSDEGGSSDCTEGTQACACGPGGVCFQGLQCVGNVCFPQGGSSATDSSATSSTTTNTTASTDTTPSTGPTTTSSSGGSTGSCGGEDGTFGCPCLPDNMCFNNLICDNSQTCTCEPGLTGCGAECVDTTTNAEHCAGCGKTCRSTSDGACVDAICQPSLALECITEQDGFTSCSEFCPTLGETCVAGGCDLRTWKSWGSGDETGCMLHASSANASTAPCRDPIPWNDFNTTLVRCCCTDTP